MAIGENCAKEKCRMVVKDVKISKRSLKLRLAHNISFEIVLFCELFLVFLLYFAFLHRIQ